MPEGEDGDVADISLGNVCYFCEVRPADEKVAVALRMCKTMKITPSPGGRQVVGLQRTVQVPRCITCKETHIREKNLLIGGYSMNAAGLFFVCSAFLIDFPNFPVLVALGLALIVGSIVLAAMASRLSPGPENRKTLAAAHRHPAVLGLKQEGWRLGGSPVTGKPQSAPGDMGGTGAIT